MCGRYTLLSEDSNIEINAIFKEIDKKYNMTAYKTGEIFPTNVVPVLNNDIELMTWGFPNFRSKGVIINARSETALEKPTFKKAVFEKRCVIPSTGFYEWTQIGKKTKYLFKLPKENILYMAGLYHIYEDEKRFVILTTAGNESISDIHNRMPLILNKNNVSDWISNTDFALSYLHTTPPMLEKSLA